MSATMMASAVSVAFLAAVALLTVLTGLDARLQDGLYWRGYVFVAGVGVLAVVLWGFIYRQRR